MSNALEVLGLWKSYDVGLRGCSLRVRVLCGVTFRVATGERLGIVGAAGAGKTTLLHCVAGLRRPDAGQVVLGGALHRTLLLLDDEALDRAEWGERVSSALLVARDAERLRGRVDRMLVLRGGRLEDMDAPLEAPAESRAIARQLAEPPARAPSAPSFVR